MNTLALGYGHRPGKTFQGGSSKTARHYIDFIVSGQSLGELVNRIVPDQIGVLGWTGDNAFESRQINEFLGLISPALPTGRTLFYVCPECGDIGCGAITAQIEFTVQGVVWKDFGFETDYSEPELKVYKDIGSFLFDRNEYAAFFRELRRQFTS